MTATTAVTGGAGFVGRHLVSALDGAGDRVRVLDLRRPAAPAGGAEYAVGSVTERGALRELLAGADRLFHLAARTDLWIDDPSEYERVNRRGTRRVMRQALESGVGRVVHVSTEAILRDFGGDAPGGSGPSASLDHLPAPSSMPGPYCRSKALGEREVRAAAREGLDVTVVNPTVPVGPGDPGRTPPGRMLLGFLRGEVPAYTETTLDLVDVRDLARGLILAAERGETGRRYVLGGERIALGGLLRSLEEFTGREMPRLRIPGPISLLVAAAAELVADHVTGRRPAATVEGVRLSRAPHRFDGGRFRRELGLELRPLTETLADTCRWLEEEGHLPPEGSP